MLPTCPILFDLISEPIRIKTLINDDKEESRVFEAEAIFQWLENVSLTDPINNQRVASISLASDLREEHKLNNGMQHAERIASLQIGIALQNSKGPVYMNPAIPSVKLVQNSANLFKRGLQWLQNEIPLPTIVVQMQRNNVVEGNPITVLVVGDTTRFQFCDLLDARWRFKRADCFLCKSEENQYDIWELAVQNNLEEMIKAHARRYDMILYFGEDRAHFRRILEKLRIEAPEQILALGTNGTQPILSPLTKHTQLHAISIRGQSYAGYALALLDAARALYLSHLECESRYCERSAATQIQM